MRRRTAAISSSGGFSLPHAPVRGVRGGNKGEPLSGKKEPEVEAAPGRVFCYHDVFFGALMVVVVFALSRVPVSVKFSDLRSKNVVEILVRLPACLVRVGVSHRKVCVELLHGG